MALVNLPGTGNSGIDVSVGNVTSLPSSPASVVVGPESSLNVALQPIAPGVPIISTLNGLTDVDLSVGLEDYSLLMYNLALGKWKPTKKLEEHYMNAGFF